MKGAVDEHPGEVVNAIPNRQLVPLGVSGRGPELGQCASDLQRDVPMAHAGKAQRTEQKMRSCTA